MMQFLIEHPTFHTALVYSVVFPMVTFVCAIGLRLLRVPDGER